MTDDRKKYNHMENVFQYLNKNYVSLDSDLMKRNNEVLSEIVDSITTKMKEKDVLFQSLYNKLFYGGSYYDGLKVGKPEEYDLDLLLRLPKYAEPVIILSTIPGFVQVQMTALEKFQNQPEYKAYYNSLPILLDKDNYVCANKVKAWMEGLVTKTLKEFPESGNVNIFTVDSKNYYAKVAKSGPAFTLKIHGDEPDERMDIDLVPCFIFTNDKWPADEFRENPYKTERPTFFVVPKAPAKNSVTDQNIDRCWRLSFQEQEKMMMNEKLNLKPSLKLLKKLRDNNNHVCISSYFIKTVFLWEIQRSDDREFWKQNLPTVYIAMLKKYAAFLQDKNIPYFWNDKFNLIEKVNPVTLENVANKLKNIISEIERNETDSYIGAKALLHKEQFEQLKKQVPISKRQLKTQTSLVSNSSRSDVVPNLSVDCVDGPGPSPPGKNGELTKVLAAINKVQQSIDKLTHSVNAVQAQQQALTGSVQRINKKIDDIESTVSNLKDENNLLKRKVNHPSDDLMQFNNLELTAQYQNNTDLLVTSNILFDEMEITPDKTGTLDDRSLP